MSVLGPTSFCEERVLKKFIFVAILLVVTLWTHRSMRQLYALPWPHFNELVIDRYISQDIGIVVSGFRRVAADMAWIQLLQYVGGEQGFDENRMGELNFLKMRALRVTRLDPYFRSVYLFAAGILAWEASVNRPDEALELLREGMRFNPEYWPFHTYTAAILFKKRERFQDMALLLEKSITHPECPTLIKSILANYYKAQKKYSDAIRIWQNVLTNDRDRNYHETARHQIRLLSGML